MWRVDIKNEKKNMERNGRERQCRKKRMETVK
jgi:hypothetical protein